MSSKLYNNLYNVGLISCSQFDLLLAYTAISQLKLFVIYPHCRRVLHSSV